MGCMEFGEDLNYPERGYNLKYRGRCPEYRGSHPNFAKAHRQKEVD